MKYDYIQGSIKGPELIKGNSKKKSTAKTTKKTTKKTGTTKKKK